MPLKALRFAERQGRMRDQLREKQGMRYLDFCGREVLCEIPLAFRNERDRLRNSARAQLVLGLSQQIADGLWRPMQLASDLPSAQTCSHELDDVDLKWR